MKIGEINNIIYFYEILINLYINLFLQITQIPLNQRTTMDIKYRVLKLQLSEVAIAIIL